MNSGVCREGLFWRQMTVLILFMISSHNTSPDSSAESAPCADCVPVRRVLVSVFDKTGIDRLAAGLKAAGVRVASTGGTATALAAHGLDVEDVSSITGFPER